MTDWTVITIEQKTLDRLKKHRKMNESFEDVINKLVDTWENYQALFLTK